MGRSVKSNIAIMCAVCVLDWVLSGFSAPLSAGEADTQSYESAAVYVDGILTTEGYALGTETVYIPVSEFADALELDYCVLDAGEENSFCASLGSFILTVAADGKYMSANGRYFYLPYGAQEIGGAYCLPVRELAALICAEMQWDTAAGGIDIDTTHMGVIENGDDYYNAEDVNWLSRIISAESGNQSLEGMMGVGNVVLNRVADPSCPDIVYDVIFDTRYGIQFSPVENGSIYLEPGEAAVVAAKLCLEGYNLAGDSLYFVNPNVGCTAWFRETRTFVVTIGDHDFYA